MARKIKKLTLAKIRTIERTVLRNLNSLLFELEIASTLDNEDPCFYTSLEEDWIDENFYEENGIFDKLDDLTEKIHEYRK